MRKIVHAQTVLLEEDVAKLKQRTGEKHIKDALSKAVEYYFEGHP